MFVEAAGVVGGCAVRLDDADGPAVGPELLGPPRQVVGRDEFDAGVGRVVRGQRARRGDLAISALCNLDRKSVG